MKATPEFFGSVYSRDPFTGEREISGHLYSFDKKSAISVKDLDKNSHSKIKRILRRLERRMRFVSEIFVLYSAGEEDFDIKLKKKAKVQGVSYPKILLDLLDEGIISEKELLLNLPLDTVKEWFASRVAKDSGAKALCTGGVISFGAGIGKITKGRNKVEEALRAGKEVVWIIEKVTTEDLKLFGQVSGVILTKSGPTSHAAVVAKALGVPAIIGCSELLKKKYEGKTVTVDANSGNVFAGGLRLVRLSAGEKVRKILNIARKYSKVRVIANADTALDAKRAVESDANGIGLCRTEHMFFEEERTSLIRQILFTDKPPEKSLEALKKFQEKDFYKLFEVEKGNEVVVRYLDAPLHEFSTNSKKNKEENPMLGMRGARMLLKKPEIIRVQTRAIFSALLRLDSEGEKITVGLEIPLVMDASEVQMFKSIVREETAKLDPTGKISYQIGAMIEIPRAAYLIDEIAKEVDFISFGTNDLTQMLLGLSRDDSGSFLDYYVEKRLLPANPFVTLDESGVGRLVEVTSKRARNANKKIKISVCGEQAGDPDSIKMLVKYDIDSLSCSPSRIPIAILASGKYSVS